MNDGEPALNQEIPGTSLRELPIEEGGIRVPGRLHEVQPSRGLAVHVHASGGARWREGPLRVAFALGRAGYSSLIVDLLTEGEARVRSWTLDVGLLADRLGRVIRWMERDPHLVDRPLALMGYGAAGPAVLRVTSRLRVQAAAIVLWDSHPDLAWEVLPTVRSPVLLLAPGGNPSALRSNRWAAPLLADCRLEIVVGARTLLGEEAWAFEAASREARRWLRQRLRWPTRPRLTVPAA